MSIVGIKELHDNIDAVLQRVREHGETIEIAADGRVVAHLIPPPARLLTEDEQAVRDANDAATWERLMRLGEEIGKSWPEGVSAVDAVRDVRRNL